MTDALLFLHLLSAAALFCGLVCFSAIALGARPDVATVRPFIGLWRAGMVGVIVFGIALSLDIDGYELWDAWILLAIALWLGAGGTGDRVQGAYEEGAAAGAPLPGALARVHWISVAFVVLLLADMIWKPWT